MSSCGTVKYFVVRHAEKESVEEGSASMSSTDPRLSPAGRVRAIELREELKDDNINHIFSTSYVRNVSTARPLSELRGNLPIQIYHPRSHDSLVSVLRNIRKGNVLVVGHSNTVDDIVNKLMNGVHVQGDLKDSEYDNLYIITRKGRSYRFSQKQFGTATE